MANLAYLVERIGEEEACNVLREHLDSAQQVDKSVLTIVVNKGVHHLPRRSLRGTVFYASEGNLNFSNAKSVENEFGEILENVTRILKERKWRQVYVLPFGPCALSMQIKLLIYRITRIESIEIFYLGDGEYMDLEIEQRSIIVRTE